MLKAWIALAGAGALLSGCANAPPTTRLAHAGGAPACAGQGACGANTPPHQQYYDEHAKRYYYYDGASGQYLWEDGTPRS